MAYRCSPHSTTGVSPSKLLFGRETRTKFPTEEQFGPDCSEVRDRDCERKQKGIDKKRNAEDCNLMLGDQFF